MEINKSLSFSAVGIFGSALLWLLSFKLVAYWLGPEGVGLFSQLRQIVQAATIGATFGGTNAVVQGLSERDDARERLRFRRTASRLIGIMMVLVVLLMMFFSPQFTKWFLSADTPDMLVSVRWICVAILLSVGSTYVIAILNGYRSYAYMASSQVVGPLAMLIVLLGMYFLHITYRPQILAFSLVSCFLVTYLVGAWGVFRFPNLFCSVSVGYLASFETRAFVKFSCSTLLASLSSSLALLLIRSWIIDDHGLAFAGLFDAAWTLTFNYITLFLTACSAIYLPLLTSATNPASQRACILKTAYLVLAGCTLVCYLLIQYRSSLLCLFYSKSFEASGNVLIILAIAAILRSISWVYGMVILATRSVRVLIMSDLVFNLGLLLMTKYSLNNFSSLEALGWAFVIPNFLYLVFVVEYVCHKNILMHRQKIWPITIAAVLPLLLIAINEKSIPIRLEYVQILFFAIGLAVIGRALLAYKKVM